MQIKNFNVGPSEIFPGVKDFLISEIKNDGLIVPHRSPAFAKIYKNTESIFRDFFEVPENYKIFFTYSATEGMEIVLRSLEEVTFINNGDFGDLFVSVGEALRVKNKVIKRQRGERVNPPTPLNKGEFENLYNSIAITANDTSTGIEYSPEELTEIRKIFPDKNIVIDATSSFGARSYDISSADAWIMSVQKNLGLPPGLGVLIVNEKIIKSSLSKEKKLEDVGGHHRLSSLLEFSMNSHTPSTPNILLIKALGFVVGEYKKTFGDIKNLEKYTNENAEYFYNKIAQIEGLEILNKGEGKSKTTFVLKIKSGNNSKIIEKLKNNGFSISPGYGGYKETNIRIANFPVHKLSDIEKLFEELEK